jgi:hypothetical protein
MSARVIRAWFDDAWSAWDRFWFQPLDPAMLGVIRILTGAMLFYTHAVWSLNFEDFFGPQPWVRLDVARQLQSDGLAWSHFWVVDSLPWLWVLHVAGLIVFLLLTVGLFSQVASVLAWCFAVSYAHRATGALFGLDQINIMLAMYLMVGPCGAAYSVDRILARRRAGGRLGPAPPSVRANVATRLIQIHMCIIYLFAGLSKLQGPTWWNGTAMWGAFANLEYQSLDMTWLVHDPILIAIATHVTVFWEISYCALVWPRLTRPIVVFLAVPLHLGIAICMGMITFGLAMLIGNLAFVSPGVARRILDRRGPRPPSALTKPVDPTRKGSGKLASHRHQAS